MRPIAILALVAAACGGDNINPDNPVDAGASSDAPIDGALAPRIDSVDYPVIAHGGALVISGANLAGATEVAIGGVAHQGLVASDTAVTVNAVLDSVPTGTQELTVTTPLGTTAAFEITVIHLVISEVEVDSPGSNTRDFIELETGVAEALSLDGYVAVQYQGAVAGGPVENIADLDADTDANGLLLIGPDTLVATPQVAFTGDIPNGEDAIAIYQFAGDVGSFPASLDEAGTTGLIDALVYKTGNDADRPVLDPLITDATRVNEGLTAEARETVSMQRCPDDLTRRKGASFRLEIPTPGRANVNCAGVAALADCTIAFDATCPDVVAGECGAIFVGAGTCENNGDAECVSAGDAYHTVAGANRIDIFLTGNLDSLETFLAPFGGTDATMNFFTLDGSTPLNSSPLQVANDCDADTPPATNTADLGDGAVRRIQITGDADIFVDAFRTNP